MDELCQWLVDEGVKTGNCVLKMAAAGGEGAPGRAAQQPAKAEGGDAIVSTLMIQFRPIYT